MGYVAVGCESLIGVMFLAAAVGKLRGRAAFASFVNSVRRLGDLPRRRARWTAGAVVTTEIAAFATLACASAGAVALGRTAPMTAVAAAGSALAVLLLAAFTIVILIAMSRGSVATCNCFGSSAARLGLRHVVRNLLLMVVTVLGAVARFAAPAGVADPPGQVIAILAGGALALVFVFFEDVTELFVSPPALGPAKPN